MPRASLRLPDLLRQLDAALPATIEVEGATLRDALRAATVAHPMLAGHLFDETGALREHVLCVQNGCQRREADLDRGVEEGDELAVMQAVSGG